MRIVTLMENITKSESIRAEHGLSLYIELKTTNSFPTVDVRMHFWTMQQFLA